MTESSWPLMLGQTWPFWLVILVLCGLVIHKLRRDKADLEPPDEFDRQTGDPGPEESQVYPLDDRTSTALERADRFGGSRAEGHLL